MKVKTTKITKANLTTVPAVIRMALKAEAGDLVEWHVENDEVIVRKVEAQK